MGLKKIMFGAIGVGLAGLVSLNGCTTKKTKFSGSGDNTRLWYTIIKSKTSSVFKPLRPEYKYTILSNINDEVTIYVGENRLILTDNDRDGKVDSYECLAYVKRKPNCPVFPEVEFVDIGCEGVGSEFYFYIDQKLLDDKLKKIKNELKENGYDVSKIAKDIEHEVDLSIKRFHELEEKRKKTKR